MLVPGRQGTRTPEIVGSCSGQAAPPGLPRQRPARRGSTAPFARTFSPNGQWIAYRSDKSGRHEIYLSRFPASPGEWQVSTEGGTWARWSPNGRELFYRSGDKMMAVDVHLEGEPVLGRPRLLFERPRLQEYYDVAPDGQRFVMVDESDSAPPARLNLVLNWSRELEQRVPRH